MGASSAAMSKNQTLISRGFAAILESSFGQ
jgi:hypothetical protein